MGAEPAYPANLSKLFSDRYEQVRSIYRKIDHDDIQYANVIGRQDHSTGEGNMFCSVNFYACNDSQQNADEETQNAKHGINGRYVASPVLSTWDGLHRRRDIFLGAGSQSGT